jgi:hypothetical protein
MDWWGIKVNTVGKNGEWEKCGRMKHEVVETKTWDGREKRGWGKGLWTQAK